MTQAGFDSWWDSLRHFGLLLSPAEVANLNNNFKPAELPRWTSDHLRRELTRFDAGDLNQHDWVALVLEETCGFNHDAGGSWLRGRHVPRKWSATLITKENLKPTHLWVSDNSVLPVFSADTARIGVGRGRKIVSDCVQWLRALNQPVALVTNGREWRLIYAGLDFDAGCEWTSELWFEGGDQGPQLWALRTLFQPKMFESGKEDEPPLLAAILASRRGQAELSSLLGERVREAVELLVQSHRDALNDSDLNEHGSEIYRAAVRVMMRLVVVLLAESRDLLPRSDPNYNNAYGLGSLFEQLQRLAARGRGRLGHRFSAWPRILSLFQLIFSGSQHPSLLVPAYGGELFAQGKSDDLSALNRALHVFETACFDSRYQLMPDAVVHKILEFLTRTEVRIRQGRTSTRTMMPVDFSDLSSEYIGILYEGLLDYELKTAPEDDPIVFLAIGDEPALPLARLEAMDDKGVKKLFEKLKDSTASDSAETDTEKNETGEHLAADTGVVTEEVGVTNDSDSANMEEEKLELARKRATEWARKACLAANLVRKPRAGASPEAQEVFGSKVDSKARQLVRRVVLPGDWYMVRWGGTRKGSGTFYTRPALAVPTVQRTLRPLAFDPPTNSDGQPDESARAEKWTPKKPEEILALKVCDPGCGSGSFPVAALRFLTDALFSSLYAHDRLEGDWRRPLPELLGLELGEGYDSLRSARLPCPPDAEDFPDRTKAVLRRYVVERCIYGVDLDPLSSELCRLALWIETMDRDLPFSFLDHKIRCGNALVGAWFDTFAHYPAMAWNREAGDKSHSNGMHYRKEELTRAVKSHKAGVVKPDLEKYLMGRDLLQQDFQQVALESHDTSLQVLATLHNLPVSDAAERGRRYREEFLGSDSYKQLKSAMDMWCALWFWPATDLEYAPLPTNFADPTPETLGISASLAAQHRFFHWELEFPDVFNAEGSGFDAMIGNPPWDIAKPNSKEYFSDIDPLYRAYGKQEALRYQTGFFADEKTENQWISYNAGFRAQSNYFKFAARSSGDPALTDKSQERFNVARGNRNNELHSNWRVTRAKSKGFADANHPYQHQGSGDINLYKLFLEQAHSLVRQDGFVGFIVPSGIYSDYGTGALRTLFVEHCQWQWLFGFENREKIFDIHRSFKFNPIIIQKGGKTEAINTAFIERRLEDWQQAEKYVTRYDRARISQFSPKSKAILEIQSERDLEILEKIYANSVLLGDKSPDGWGIEYAREFDMTNDSKLFPPRPKWEAKGYRPDEYSRWLLGNWRPIGELWAEMGVQPLADGEKRCAQPPYDTLPIPRADIAEGVILSRGGDAWITDSECEVALPVYNAKMINLFDFSSKGWVSGKGRSSVWKDLNFPKIFEPEYLMNLEVFRNNGVASESQRLLFKDISTAVHFRTMLCALTPPWPAVNAAPLLGTSQSEDLWALQAFLASFCLDYVARFRIGYLHLNYFVIEELPLIRREQLSRKVLSVISSLVRELANSHMVFAPVWLKHDHQSSWRSNWAITESARLKRRCILDAIVAHLYGLDHNSFKSLLHDCDLPTEILTDKTRLNPKGFWRVDQNSPPEMRHSVLSYVAYCDLAVCIEKSESLEKAIVTFASPNSRQQWDIPAKLRLADYNLGHDARAKEYQLVSEKLGSKNIAWQSSEDKSESWQECLLHVRNLLGQSAYKRLLSSQDSPDQNPNPKVDDINADAALSNEQGSLF